ncbi:DUF262 domain-containing protein [Janibacter terrae]|uniref:DUF262 domain-containing protein n=1 Tax=Janibacter terrae TaxID=103817 RepID=UPI0031F724E8
MIEEDAPKDIAVDDAADDTAGATPPAEESLRHFTADFDVAGIVRRMNDGNFTVPNFDPPPVSGTGYAGFQRNYIWTKKQKDRFIESLLLGYPVPGIFLVEEPGRKYLVLDGQQRLKTLQDFINGTDSQTERVFRLQFVGDETPYSKRSFAELTEFEQNLLQNTFIQVTVVVPKVSGNLQGVYQLFERINSGGTNLQPQEIRIALYAGTRVDALRQLNADKNWRSIFGPPHSRLKDTELILRYLAFREVAIGYGTAGWERDAPKEALDAKTGAVESQQVYRAPVNQFLNSYLESLGPEGCPTDEAMQAFPHVCAVLAPLGKMALRLDDSAQINAAHTDAILATLSLHPKVANGMRDPQAVSRRVAELLAVLEADAAYTTAVRESTSHLASVHRRLQLAHQAFQAL